MITRLTYQSDLALYSIRRGEPIHFDKSNQLALVAWMAQEDSHASCNPFDTAEREPGSADLPGNPDHVQTYQTVDEGMIAFFDTLTGPNAAEFGYPPILAALKAGGCACAVVEAVARSSWGTWFHNPTAAVGFMLHVEKNFAQYANVSVVGS